MRQSVRRPRGHFSLAAQPHPPSRPGPVVRGHRPRPEPAPRATRHYGFVQTSPAPAPSAGTSPPPPPGPRSRRVAVEVGLGRGGPADKARDLRRMKTLATGLLLGATVVFLLARWGEAAGAPGWVGYVRATAEPAMVGALADWFAVTALFRHPAGLPIPHTAIIPRKKDQIGTSLGTFVRENFLTRAVVEDRLDGVDVPGRLGAFLAAPGRAERLAGDAGAALGALTDLLRDEDLQPAVAALVDRKLREPPAAPALARVLELVVEGDRHQEVLSAGLTGLAKFLAENRVVFRARLGDASPAWVPDWVDDRVFTRVFDLVQGFLAEVGEDPRHELRRSYDKRLRAYVHALRTDPATAARVEHLKEELLDHPAVRAWSGSLWSTAKNAVVTAAADPESELRT